jgi:hypothetical protein
MKRRKPPPTSHLPKGRLKGSKNAKTKAREKARRIEAALAEYGKQAPPIDYKATFDSLEMMEGVMRHFYIRAMIEQRQGDEADWNKVDNLLLKVLSAAEKVAKYRHAQIAAIRLSGDLNKQDNVSVDDLLASIRADWAVIGPLIEMEPTGVENRLPGTGGVTGNG